MFLADCSVHMNLGTNFSCNTESLVQILGKGKGREGGRKDYNKQTENFYVLKNVISGSLIMAIVEHSLDSDITQEENIFFINCRRDK